MAKELFLLPMASGVTPLAFSLSTIWMNSSYVVSSFGYSTPALSNNSLL